MNAGRYCRSLVLNLWVRICADSLCYRVQCQVSGLFTLLQPKRSGTSVVDHLAAGSQQVCEQMKLLSIIYFLL